MEVEQLLAGNKHLVLATADASGQPWATPVFFAPLGDGVCWVSSPESRHSRNIAERASIAITVFDSTVEIGHAEAAYFDAETAPVTDTGAALAALNSRLPAGKQLEPDDLLPDGPLLVYRAEPKRRYVLVRGGNAEHGNATDMTLEV